MKQIIIIIQLCKQNHEASLHIKHVTIFYIFTIQHNSTFRDMISVLSVVSNMCIHNYFYRKTFHITKFPWRQLTRRCLLTHDIIIQFFEMTSSPFSMNLYFTEHYIIKLTSWHISTNFSGYIYMNDGLIYLSKIWQTSISFHVNNFGIAKNSLYGTLRV